MFFLLVDPSHDVDIGRTDDKVPALENIPWCHGEQESEG